MKKLFVAIFILLAGCCASAQSDAGSWINFQLNKKLGNAYGFARIEHRSNEDFSNTECYFAVLGGGYNLTKWLKADANYEYWHINGVGDRHKAVVTANGTLKRSELSVTLREKLELSFNPDNGSCAPTLRSRLRAQYAIPNCGVRPYAMAEVFTWDNWQRSLNYIGAEVTLCKSMFADIYYLYHLPAGGCPVHVFGLGLYLNL